jgi:Na+/H+ antiporter NhaD/arsenite permease-like protein
VDAVSGVAVSYLALVLFVGTFVLLGVRQVSGRGPPLWVILLGGGVLTVLTGLLSFPAAAAVLVGEVSVLTLLFSLFVFVAALDGSGTLEYLSRWILSRARGVEDLPFLLFLGFGVLAGFVLNDALVLVGVPLVFAVARSVKTDPTPLLFTLAYSVTVGSVLTPLGNPQNLLVALGSGIPAPIAVFFRYLLLPTAINLAVGAWYLRWSYRSELHTSGPRLSRDFPKIPLFPHGGWAGRLRRSPVLLIFPVTIGSMVGLDVYTDLTGVSTPPIAEIALVGALVLLLVSPGRFQFVARVDWKVLLLFVGLFLVVGGAEAGGLLTVVQNLLPIPGPSAPRALQIGGILGASLLGPQLVSNVPWVALQIPVLHGLGYGSGTPLAWLALSAGSTLAGSVTLLGAASNLIIVEEAEKRSVSLHLGPFIRRGLPLVAITTSILFVCLLLGL